MRTIDQEPPVEVSIQFQYRRLQGDPLNDRFSARKLTFSLPRPGPGVKVPDSYAKQTLILLALVYWRCYTDPAGSSYSCWTDEGELEMNAIEVVEADLRRPEHQSATLDLLDAYARDTMGNGAPLSADVRRLLTPGLREHPTTIVFLAYGDGDFIGLAVCFRGFSTFAAKPLINIHDLVVLSAHRGRGVGRRHIEAVADKGRSLDCCKLTLEVLENNHRARQLYDSAGFAQAMYQPEAGGALFMSKAL